MSLRLTALMSISLARNDCFGALLLDASLESGLVPAMAACVRLGGGSARQMRTWWGKSSAEKMVPGSQFSAEREPLLFSGPNVRVYSRKLPRPKRIVFYPLTLTFTTFDFAALGSVMLSTPFLYEASTFSGSTSVGSVISRLKLPWLLSMW